LIFIQLKYSLFSQDEAEADQCISRGHWAQAVDALARIEEPNVRVLNKHGCLLREHFQDLEGALECHQDALTQATDRVKAETFIYLAIVHYDMKQYDQAIKDYSQALEWFEKEHIKDSAMIARCLVGLGNAHWARRELDEALACAERALVLREHAVQPRNDFDIAACLGNMGNILHDQGDNARALTCAKRAVDILTKCARNDPRLSAALNNVGAMYQGCGEYEKAREYYERALQSLPNENHPHRQSTLNNIARLNQMEKAQR
jgi:tetratricopeptide (TPR) repeat protein